MEVQCHSNVVANVRHLLRHCSLNNKRHCCQHDVVYCMLWDSELSLVAHREQPRITLTASMADWEQNISTSNASLQLAETLAHSKQLQKAGTSHTTVPAWHATSVSQYCKRESLTAT